MFRAKNGKTIGAFAADKKVVFVAGAKSHGYFSHEHAAGCKLLAKYLNEAKIGLKAVVVTDNGYPKDPSVFDDAAAVAAATGVPVREVIATAEAIARGTPQD